MCKSSEISSMKKVSESSNSSTAINCEPNNSTNITKLRKECLELIFSHLKMEELFNVALTSKEFTDIAAKLFKRKYGEMTIRVHPYEIYAYKDEYRLHEQFDIGWVSPFNEFAFLRIFGSSISTLHIVSLVGKEMMDAINSYASLYCSRANVTKRFIVPHRWTPSKYASLKTLIASTLNESSKPLPPAHESLSFLCSNQIRWQRVSFILENLKHLSLTQYEWNTLNPPPITFINLELLEVRTFFSLERKWFQFLTRHKHLIKLNLFSHERKHIEKKLLLELVVGLPRLKILILNVSSIDIESIPDFLASSNTLKHLRLYAGWWDNEDSFRGMFTGTVNARFDDQWDIFAGFGRVTFIRKILNNSSSVENDTEVTKS